VKIKIVIVGLLMALLISVIVAWMVDVNKIRNENRILENRNKYLEFQLSYFMNQNKLNHNKLMAANQELERLHIDYEADELFIEAITKRFEHLVSYVVIVNMILEANDIQVPNYVYKYVDESGNVRDIK